MRVIIRYVESKGIGKQVSQSVFDGNKVTLGRGSDQVVQIPDKRIALEHSSLRQANDGLELKAVAKQRFSYEGQRTKLALLKIGDTVSISGHSLSILAGEDGADFVLEMKLEEEKIEQLRDRYTTRLREVGFPGRKVSWALFVSVIAIGLLIPAAGFFVGMDKVRNSPLPDDSIWLTGPIHQTHAFIGDDCSACHVEAFTQTRDEECLACHETINHHFDPMKFGTAYGAGNNDEECADCHKEHSPTGSITRRDQKSCAVCHADLPGAGFDSDRLEPATDFFLDHPQFRVTLHTLDQDISENNSAAPVNDWITQRLDPQLSDVAEQSNLIFPHDVHLDAKGINAPEGKQVMVCGDCHQPEKGGLRMKQVSMEVHCADCHELTFDPASPNRVVPHGSPPDLMRTLREYYAYEFIAQQSGEANHSSRTATLELPQTRKVRRPGRTERTRSITDILIETSVDKSVPQSQQAMRFIEAKVSDAAANLFEKQTCTICHDVTKDVTKDDGAEVPWQIKPVKVSENWMPLAFFSHDRHGTTACGDCHEAQGSNVSSDILMPDLDSCRTCHGGEDAKGLLQSSCITCHDFHLSGFEPMGHPMLGADLGSVLDSVLDSEIKRNNPASAVQNKTVNGMSDGALDEALNESREAER